VAQAVRQAQPAVLVGLAAHTVAVVVGVVLAPLLVVLVAQAQPAL
jgi:hypothetical protein